MRGDSPLERGQPNGSAFCTYAVARPNRDQRYRFVFVRIDVHADERQARARGTRWMAGSGAIPRVPIPDLGDEAWHGGMLAFRRGNVTVVVDVTADLASHRCGPRDHEIEEQIARLIAARLP